MIILYFSIWILCLVAYNVQSIFVQNITALQIQEIFTRLNDESFEVFKQQNTNTFVCLNPNSGQYGGFGNLLLTVFAVQSFGLIAKRLPIINHQLVLSLFNHPDPRQKWDIISSNELMNHKNQVTGSPGRCRDIANTHLKNFAEKIGLNGCTSAYVSHPDAVGVFKSILPTVENVPYYDFTVNMISQWMLSNPTPIWEESVENHRKRVLSGCGEGTKRADLAIQFRTWRDVINAKSTFHEVGGGCHMDCAIKLATNFLHNPMTSQHSNNYCVFVTSDNRTSTSLLVDALNSLNVGVNDTSSSSKLPFITAVYDKFTSDDDWHSVGIVQGGRSGGGLIDKFTLSERSDLLDWMLLGDATQALYTKGSTYGVSARMRLGIQHQIDDYVSIQESAHCKCERVFPNHDHLDQLRYRSRLLEQLINE